MKEFSQPVTVRVSRHGELLAASDRAVLLREGSLPEAEPIRGLVAFWTGTEGVEADAA